MKNTILIIDDEQSIRLLLENFLSKDFQIICKSDGIQALEWLEGNLPDLIICDVQMPNMDGREATRLIREKESGTGAHVPIIALTALALKGDRELCIDAGMDGYVTKPVRRTQLLEAIDAATGHLQVADRHR